MNRQQPGSAASWLPLGLIALLMLVGCGEQSRDEILTPIRKNLKALDQGEIERSMEFMHPDSPKYESTRRILNNLHGRYKLNYKLEELEILEVNQNKARVQFVQITRKKSGPKFKDNRLKGVHILKKHNGKWKIWDSKQKEIKYLD